MKLLVGGVSTVLVALVATVILGGFTSSPHKNRALAEDKPEVVEETVTIAQDKFPLNSSESSIGLPPVEELSGITPAHSASEVEDVERTFKVAETKASMTRALSKVNAGISINVGGEVDVNSKIKYDRLVKSYTNKIYSAGSAPDGDTSIKNYLSEFEAQSLKLKRIEVANSVTLDEPVTMQPPQLSEEYLTYMPYTAVTAKGTPHYKLRKLATSTEDGYRVYQGATLVALASYYGTEIGSIYNIYFDDGKMMKAMLGDNKSDLHTDPTHRYRDSTEKYDGSSGNIVEIIFDTAAYDNLDRTEKMRRINEKINSDYSGKVTKIERIGKAKDF